MNVHPVILFDGVCKFCNYWVNFAIRRDKKKNLRFAALQNEAAQNLLKEFDMEAGSLSSVILIDNGRVYTQSSAAFRMYKYLDGGWKLLHIFIVIPKFIRDFIYNIIARNRYKWFGKNDKCMVPTPELEERFLD